MMLPTAGLYLPESLYPKKLQATEGQDKLVEKLRYFERKLVQPKSKERTPSDQQSTTPSRSTSATDADGSSPLSTVFYFAEFASTLGGISSENETFIRLIQHVRRDLAEASRLHCTRVVSDYLESWPDSKMWIDGVLSSVQQALNDIGTFMESVRVTGDDGGAVALRRRFEWILGHHKKFINKQQYLNTCHQSLMTAIQRMQAAEIQGGLGGFQNPIYEAPVQLWVQESGDDILCDPYSRQKWINIHPHNTSLPSITASEAEQEKVDAHSNYSNPVELPGCTPDDLHDPENWDLYAPLKKQEASDKIMPHNSGQHVELATDPKDLEDDISPRTLLDPELWSVPLESKSRKNVGQIRPLPTLPEKHVERTDSAASIRQANTFPMLPKRAKEVQVQKSYRKDRSSSAQLPYLPAQPSLYAELSEWIVPGMHEDCHVTNTGDFETIASSTSSKTSSVAQTQPNSTQETASCITPIAAHSVRSIPSFSKEALLSFDDTSPRTDHSPTPIPSSHISPSYPDSNLQHSESPPLPKRYRGSVARKTPTALYKKKIITEVSESTMEKLTSSAPTKSPLNITEDVQISEGATLGQTQSDDHPSASLPDAKEKGRVSENNGKKAQELVDGPTSFHEPTSTPSIISLAQNGSETTPFMERGGMISGFIPPMPSRPPPPVPDQAKIPPPIDRDVSTKSMQTSSNTPRPQLNPVLDPSRKDPTGETLAVSNAKPKTAQTKRREAQARRMRVAFRLES